MQKTIKFSLTLVFVTLLQSCLGVYICSEGSGIITRQMKEIQPFKTIVINIPGNIFFYQGETSKVEIETDDNLLRLITIELQNEELILDSDKSICPRKLNIYVTNPYLEGFEINSSADFFSQTPISTSKLIIQVNGSSDIRIDSVNAEKVVTQINGSGDVRLGGFTEFFISKINGSGDLRASKLVAKVAKTNTNGSGDVYISVTDELRAEINGSGDVYYYGSPKITEININGSGEVNQIDKKMP